MVLNEALTDTVPLREAGVGMCSPIIPYIDLRCINALNSFVWKWTGKALLPPFSRKQAPRTIRCSSWISKRQRNQRSNCQHLLDHQKSKKVPEKHLLLLYWLCQSLWLCGSQQNVENSLRERNTRPPDLLPEKYVCSSRSNSKNWSNRLVPNRERSTSRLYIVTLLI